MTAALIDPYTGLKVCQSDIDTGMLVLPYSLLCCTGEGRVGHVVSGSTQLADRVVARFGEIRAWVIGHAVRVPWSEAQQNGHLFRKAFAHIGVNAKRLVA